ncbi:MAG TPA: hypothetical protein VJQ53_04505 [Candidatus Eisenbacteria bacterium]|nr:hypothetical protein [Candidatus Eisenbacteria bacterium]
MTTVRPHHVVASLLIVVAAAIAVGWAGRAGSAGGADPAAKESTPAAKESTPAAKESTPAAPAPTGHEGHQMPATSGTAKSQPEPGQGMRMTITGEVMDPACFLEAGPKSIGPGHFQCAIDCARSGQTLAIYDRANDRIYFIAGELPGKNPNDPVINFIHQKVDVTGGVYHRSGVYGIVITKVVPHKEKG